MKVKGLFHPPETAEAVPAPMTEADIYNSSIVPGCVCSHCGAGALFDLPPLCGGWRWCSHCGSLCSMVHNGYIAPDMAESPGN